MITLERIQHSGAIVACAYVTDGCESWLESRAYYGYETGEIRGLYIEHLKANGLSLKSGI
jgi:hypothetical protein